VSRDLFDATDTAPGLLVTVDGPNGSGKTSLIEAVLAHLDTARPVYGTRQPSPTPLGELIRSSELSFRGRALACLVAGDRHHQIDSEILPRLRAGEIVLCDHYVESSLVLQRLDGVDLDEVVALNRGILRPDLRIRLLADAAVLRTRLAARAADASRRFERAADGPERELAYYADADRMLTDDHGLPAAVYDTSGTETAELGAEVARLTPWRS
jgi:dTMP kinase